MFKKARIKLTAWYLLIIMTISVVFSLIIYSMVNSEFVRFEHMQKRRMLFEKEGLSIPRGMQNFQIETEEIENARFRFLTALGLINISIFVVAGGAGFFLAGKTLKPIKEMMDEQNRFVSDSSHEFRTPLTTLRTEIEVALRSKKLKADETKKILKSNLEEVINMQILTSNLLELAQNGSSIKNSQKEKVLVHLIVQNAIKRVGPSTKTKQIKIASRIPGGKVIMGVPDRLTEVFVILLDNAIKYSPQKGNIEIESKKTDGKVKILVTDHGKGISEKDMPHIFERFYRSDESRSENGYGLGLSIAKKIIESHNGSISVKSNPGKETVFVVTLPLSFQPTS